MVETVSTGLARGSTGLGAYWGATRWRPTGSFHGFEARGSTHWATLGASFHGFGAHWAEGLLGAYKLGAYRLVPRIWGPRLHSLGWGPIGSRRWGPTGWFHGCGARGFTHWARGSLGACTLGLHARSTDLGPADPLTGP